MAINFSAILPHGFKLLKKLTPDQDEKSKDLSDALEDVAKQIYEQDPDIIILASPHNLRIHGKIGIITTEWCKGLYTEENVEGSLSQKWLCDREFALKLYARTKKSEISAVAVNFGAASGEVSAMEMDWGTFVPLFSIKDIYENNDKKLPKMVLITPSREIPWVQLVKLGEEITALCEEENKNGIFIASADQGHAHDPFGPYGLDDASRVYDEKICNLIRTDSLQGLLSLDEKFIEKAKPDSLWQMLVLLGIIERNNLKNKNCLYQCPDYYGMIVATFEKEE